MGTAGDVAKLVSVAVVIPAKDMAEVVSAATVVVAEVASMVAEGSVYQLLLTLIHGVTLTNIVRSQ